MLDAISFSSIKKTISYLATVEQFGYLKQKNLPNFASLPLLMKIKKGEKSLGSTLTMIDHSLAKRLWKLLAFITRWLGGPFVFAMIYYGLIAWYAHILGIPTWCLNSSFVFHQKGRDWKLPQSQQQFHCQSQCHSSRTPSVLSERQKFNLKILNYTNQSYVYRTIM